MKATIARLSQLLALYFALFHIGPWVNSFLPDANPLLIEVFAVVLTAIATELLIVAVSPPEVSVDWRDERNPNVLRELNVDSTRLVAGEIYLQMSVTGRARSPLGWLVLAIARRGDLQLRVDMPAAPSYILVDVSLPPSEDADRVRSVAGSNGVTIDLSHPPLPNTWVWARVLLQPRHPDVIVTNDLFDIVVSRHASTRFARACARVIRTSSSAKTMSLYR